MDYQGTSPKPSLRGQLRVLQHENTLLRCEQTKLRKALTIVAEWRLPDTGMVYNNGYPVPAEGAADDTKPVKFEALYGSGGAETYIRRVASNALNSE